MKKVCCNSLLGREVSLSNAHQFLTLYLQFLSTSCSTFFYLISSILSLFIPLNYTHSSLSDPKSLQSQAWPWGLIIYWRCRLGKAQHSQITAFKVTIFLKILWSLNSRHQQRLLTLSLFNNKTSNSRRNWRASSCLALNAPIFLDSFAIRQFGYMWHISFTQATPNSK